MPQLVWLITGCSVGLGRSLATAALSRSDKVIATARAPVSRLADLEQAGATTLEVDVSADEETLFKIAEHAISIYGHIDVLVCNAGYIELGMNEDLSAEKWARQFAVNFYGSTYLVRALLPHFRTRRTGIIAFSNSIYAHFSVPGNAPYTATKHAIAGYVKSLAKEVDQFNIKPILFDIGYMNTALPDNIKFTPPGSADYAELANGLMKMAEGISGNAPGDPEKCVNRMVDVIKSEGLAAGKPTPLMVPMGSDAYLTIKKNAEKTLRICEEWKELSQSIDFPNPRRGFFVDKEYYE